MSNHQRVMKGYQIHCLVLLWVYVCLSVDSVTGQTLQAFSSPDAITSPGADVAPMASTTSSVTTAETARPTPKSPSLVTTSSESEDILNQTDDDQPPQNLINNSTDGHVSSESASTSAGTTKPQQETSAGSFSAMNPTTHPSESNHSLVPSEENPDGQATTVTSITSNVIDSSTAQIKQKPKKTTGLVIGILVVIVILAVLFFVMLFLLLRKKRRSGSQNFSKRSRKANGENVWAGQVPELAEGNGMVENGTVAPASQVRVEQELTTFGEKRDNSVVEMEELVAVGTEKQSKKDSVTSEEQKPLLAEDFEGSTADDKGAKEEQFPLPPPEQDMAVNVEQANATASGDS